MKKNKIYEKIRIELLKSRIMSYFDSATKEYKVIIKESSVSNNINQINQICVCEKRDNEYIDSHCIEIKDMHSKSMVKNLEKLLDSIKNETISASW